MAVPNVPGVWRSCFVCPLTPNHPTHTARSRRRRERRRRRRPRLRGRRSYSLLATRSGRGEGDEPRARDPSPSRGGAYAFAGVSAGVAVAASRSARTAFRTSFAFGVAFGSFAPTTKRYSAPIRIASRIPASPAEIPKYRTVTSRRPVAATSSATVEPAPFRIASKTFPSRRGLTRPSRSARGSGPVFPSFRAGVAFE